MRQSPVKMSASYYLRAGHPQRVSLQSDCSYPLGVVHYAQGS